MKSPLLILAIDYHQMFKGFLDRLAQNKDAQVEGWKDTVDTEINWAKQILKKNDRIVWYLRLVRLKLIDDAQRAGFLAPGTLEKEISAYNAKSGATPLTKQDLSGIRDDYRFKRDMQHYMSIEDRDMQSYQFSYQTPQELMTALADFDKAYKEKAEADQRLLEPHENDKAFIKFGNGWAWWLLDRGYCSEEAKAMGHCGNVGEVTGDRILSLREPRQKGGKSYWEPHLTFILDQETGLLGEMKGRGNEKPATRYHPYIISLLKDKRIKGIKGGGYAPSHNFSMADLPEKDRSELEKVKPALMTLRRYMEKAGLLSGSSIRLERDKKTKRMTIPFKDQAQKKFIANKAGGMLNLPSKYSEKLGGWILREWESVASLVEDKGDRVAQYIMEYESGDRYLDLELHTDENEKVDLLTDLPKETTENIGLYLEQEFPDELRDFIEMQGGDKEYVWEVNVPNDVKEFYEYLSENGVDNKVSEDLDTSIRYGYEGGTMHEMSKALEEGVKNASDGGDRVTMTWDGADKGANVWSGKLYAVLKLADGVEAAMECEEGEGCDTGPYENGFADEILDNQDFEVKVDEPYNGWSDYDKGAAVEHMKEEYGKPPKPPQKKPVEGQGEMFPEVYEKA